MKLMNDMIACALAVLLLWALVETVLLLWAR